MPSTAGTAWASAAWVARPALRLMLRRRAARGREIPARIHERFGIDRSARPPGTLLWLHAASVGETLSVLPVLPLLPADMRVLFTTGTVTSATLLAQRLAEAGDAPWASCVAHRFVPLDVPSWVAAFLDHWRPDAACFVESELWPNLLFACRARGIPMGLINARLSTRSARRWRMAGGFLPDLLRGFRWIAAQSEADAARLRAAGARNVTAPGNLKIAAPPLSVDADALAHLKAGWLPRKMWLAASTHPGEEEIALAVHRTLVPRHPGLVTIVVPRHPGRGETVARLLAGAPRWSLRQGPPAQGFWVGDTIGDMGLFYRLSPIVFLGKSLAGNAGGQNPWEPARLGCAIAVGPRTANFDDAVHALSAAGGLTIVDDTAALAAWVGRLLDEPALQHSQGQAAAAAAAASAADLPAQIAAMIAGLVA